MFIMHLLKKCTYCDVFPCFLVQALKCYHCDSVADVNDCNATMECSNGEKVLRWLRCTIPLHRVFHIVTCVSL